MNANQEPHDAPARSRRSRDRPLTPPDDHLAGVAHASSSVSRFRWWQRYGRVPLAVFAVGLASLVAIAIRTAGWFRTSMTRLARTD